MTGPQRTAEDIARIRALLQDKLGASGASLAAGLRKVRRRLPRGIHAQARALAAAETLAGHPKLCLTLDTPALARAATQVQAHLERIDLADRRRSWWLGMLGGLAFNLLALMALLIGVLVWRGMI